MPDLVVDQEVGDEDLIQAGTGKNNDQQVHSRNVELPGSQTYQTEASDMEDIVDHEVPSGEDLLVMMMIDHLEEEADVAESLEKDQVSQIVSHKIDKANSETETVSPDKIFDKPEPKSANKILLWESNLVAALKSLDALLVNIMILTLYNIIQKFVNVMAIEVDNDIKMQETVEWKLDMEANVLKIVTV